MLCSEEKSWKLQHNNQHTEWFLRRHPKELCMNKYPYPWWSVILFHPSVVRWSSRHVQQPLKTKSKHYQSQICFIIIQQDSIEVKLSIIIVFWFISSFLVQTLPYGPFLVICLWKPASLPQVPYNKLPTSLAGSSRTGEYWASVVLYVPRRVRSLLAHTMTTGQLITQYGPCVQLVRN